MPKFRRNLLPPSSEEEVNFCRVDGAYSIRQRSAQCQPSRPDTSKLPKRRLYQICPRDKKAPNMLFASPYTTTRVTFRAAQSITIRFHKMSSP